MEGSSMGVTQVLGKGLWGADTPGGVLYTFDATACCSKQAIFVMGGCAQLDTVPYGRLIIALLTLRPSFTLSFTLSFTYTETQLTPLLASSHFGSLLFYCSTVLLFYCSPVLLSSCSTVLLFYWRLAKLDYIANMSRPQPITPLTWREETPNYIRRSGKLTFEIRRTVIWDSSARLVDIRFTLFIQQFSTDAKKIVFS